MLVGSVQLSFLIGVELPRVKRFNLLGTGITKKELNFLMR